MMMRLSDITPCIEINKPQEVYRFWQHDEMKPITLCQVYMAKSKRFSNKNTITIFLTSYDKKRILHLCSCIIEFIKLVAKASLAFYLFSPNSFNKVNNTGALMSDPLYIIKTIPTIHSVP